MIFVRADPDEEEELGATYHETLDDLLKVADCVTLHTPLNKGTQDLIDARSLSLMKPGSRVNTARGQVVNEDALIAVLESGYLSAAALEVHYHEPRVSPRLARMENVTLTTHVGEGPWRQGAILSLIPSEISLRLLGRTVTFLET